MKKITIIAAAMFAISMHGAVANPAPTQSAPMNNGVAHTSIAGKTWDVAKRAAATAAPVAKKAATIVGRTAWGITKAAVGLGGLVGGGYFWFVHKDSPEGRSIHTDFVDGFNTDLKGARRQESYAKKQFDLKIKEGFCDEEDDFREIFYERLGEAKQKGRNARLKKIGIYGGEVLAAAVCLGIAESGLRDLWQLWKEHKVRGDNPADSANNL